MKGDLAGPFLSLSWLLLGQELVVPEATGMWVTVTKVVSTAEQRVSTGDFPGVPIPRNSHRPWPSEPLVPWEGRVQLSQEAEETLELL